MSEVRHIRAEAKNRESGNGVKMPSATRHITGPGNGSVFSNVAYVNDLSGLVMGNGGFYYPISLLPVPIGQPPPPAAYIFTCPLNVVINPGFRYFNRQGVDLKNTGGAAGAPCVIYCQVGKINGLRSFNLPADGQFYTLTPDGAGNLLVS